VYISNLWKPSFENLSNFSKILGYNQCDAFPSSKLKNIKLMILNNKLGYHLGKVFFLNIHTTLTHSFLILSISANQCKLIW